VLDDAIVLADAMFGNFEAALLMGGGMGGGFESAI
jgi:hypothetical protein